MKNRTYGPANVRSASFDADANTVDVVWSTGSDVIREDYNGFFIERLSMQPSAVRLDRLNNGAPFLDTHSSESLSNVIGSVVPGSAKIEDGRGVATIKLSSANCDSDIVQKIKDGVIRNISVGYLIYKSVRDEGQSGGLDVVTATDWEPLEVSAVPIPADPNAQIRSAIPRRAKRRSRAQSAAAYARSLLGQRSQSAASARGAAEARTVLGSVGRMKPVDKVGKIDRREVERGAAEARKLLRRA